ncbi:MAG: calcium/sodium antiporter [Oscillospiraceae bacterium]
MWAIIFLVVGFILLVKGADYFVEGASSLATTMRIPAVIIGLTIVAFGTSAPELAVSLSAAIQGDNAVSLGNIIGSNIFNLLGVVGICAVMKPLDVHMGMIKKDYPLSILAAVVLLVTILDKFLYSSDNFMLDRGDGIILLLFFTIFMITIIAEGLKSRKENFSSESNYVVIKQKRSTGMNVLILLTSLIAIIIGGKLVVDGATDIAILMGVSDTLIGLTIVAIGTSLPELVTSIVATRKGENDIAVGNVVGSNIFNIFFILGISSTIMPIESNLHLVIDTVILLAVSTFFFIPIIKTKKVTRLSGILMVITYVIYTAYIIMR